MIGRIQTLVGLPSAIQERLTIEDDPALWGQVLKTLAEDASTLATVNDGSPLYAEIGVCSHWLRPHQTRWTATEGFAAPKGYMVRAAGSRLQESAFHVWIGALGSSSIPLQWIGWFQRNCQQRASNRSVLPFLPVQLDIAKLRCILFGGAGHSMPGINEPLFMDSATRMAFGN